MNSKVEIILNIALILAGLIFLLRFIENAVKLGELNTGEVKNE